MYAKEIYPSELKLNKECIWCKKNNKKNRAHIISKKLTLNVHNAPVLKFGVCESCNSICGKLEEWILSRTPLNWIKLMLYVGGGSEATSKSPAYYFSSVINEWIVFSIYVDKETRNYHHVATQFIIPNNDKNAFLTSFDLMTNVSETIDLFKQSIKNKTYKVDNNKSLPKTFSPRLILDNNNVILIIKDKNEIDIVESFIKDIKNDSQMKNGKILKLNPRDSRIHYKWSTINWTKFCAKSAFEALYLFKGSDLCLKATFNNLREFVLSPLEKAKIDVVFNNKRPTDYRFLTPIHVDLTNNSPSTIPALIPDTKNGQHEVILYEVNGWLVATVLFTGFPPVVLVLASDIEKLDLVYKMYYDYKEEKYYFYELSKPEKLKNYTPEFESQITNQRSQ